VRCTSSSSSESDGSDRGVLLAPRDIKTKDSMPADGANFKKGKFDLQSLQGTCYSAPRSRSTVCGNNFQKRRREHPRAAGSLGANANSRSARAPPRL
jgi:hypothetical protein